MTLPEGSEEVAPTLGKRYIFINYWYVKRYLAWVRRNRRTDITIEVYHYELRRFFAEFPQPIWKLTIEVLEGYLDNHINWAIESERKVISILTEFMRYLRKKEDVLPDNRHTDPLNLDIKLDRRRVVDRKITTPKELKTLISGYKCNTDDREVRFLRDKAILMVLFYSGVRVSEVGRLTLNSIREPMRDSPDQRYLFIVGKGGDERFTIVNERTIAAITAYCEVAAIPPDEPIFLLGEPAIRKMIKKLSKGKVGGKKGYLTPHDFRRGFACYAYYQVSNKDILRVEDWLGHVSLETTQIYVRGCSKLVEEFVGKLGKW